MTPPPPRPPPSRASSHSARGSAGTSALSQLTNAFMGSLYKHKGSKSTRVLKSTKAKVHVDNRSSSRRSMRRTTGRNADSDALAYVSGGGGGSGIDPLHTRKISIRERSSGRAGADALAVDLANAALVSADVQGIPSAAPPRRPTMLAATQNDAFSDSLRTLKSRILGEAPSEKNLTRKRDGKDDQFDFVDGTLGGGDTNDVDGDGVIFDEDDDEFDDDDDNADDAEAQRMRALAAAEQDELAYFSHRGASFDFKVGRRWVLHPYGRVRAAWDCFLFGLVTWMLLTTPFELSFRELSLPTRRVILSLDYFLDVMFVLDIVLNFMTAVEYDGRLHFSYQSIRRHYVSGWFLMDALWTMPFYALTGTTGADVPAFMSMGHFFQADLYPLLRIFRLARIVSLARIRKRLEFSLRISSSSSSLGGFVYSVLALSHLFSCMFAYLAFGDDYHLGLALADRNLEDDSIFSKYIASSYWSMMTIATVGYGDLTVKTNAGRLFSILAMVMGGGIFAYGISNVVDLFQQLYVEETEHRHKMDQVNLLMHHRALPRKLRDEIRANFFHLRKATRENKSADRAIVQQMSRTMQAHVADLFCLEIMPTRMPTLAGCNAEFIHELYLAMDVQCYLPGEDIIRQDDFGSEMFFLFVGHVQVFVGHAKVALFGPNTCFGEFAIMNPRRPRLATIQAMDFCETHCVSRAQLLTILIRHPFMLRSIRQLVQLRHRKALAILTDQTTKTRTLIQSLAGVWHTDGLQAIMPPGVKVEDLPELQQFAVVERAFSPMTRLASVRMGLASTARRRSVSTGDFAPGPGGAAAISNSEGLAAAQGAASLADALVRRRSSIRPGDPLSMSVLSGDQGGAASAAAAASGAATARAKRVPLRGADGSVESSSRYASGALSSSDDRIGLLLHQMNLLLKRQEKLELQMTQLAETRQHRGSVHVSYPTAAAGTPAGSDALRARTSVTDLAKVSVAQESPL